MCEIPISPKGNGKFWTIFVRRVGVMQRYSRDIVLEYFLWCQRIRLLEKSLNANKDEMYRVRACNERWAESANSLRSWQQLQFHRCVNLVVIFHMAIGAPLHFLRIAYTLVSALVIAKTAHRHPAHTRLTRPTRRWHRQLSCMYDTWPAET